MTKAEQKAYIEANMKKKRVVYYRSDQSDKDLRSISVGGWEGLQRHPEKELFVLVAHPNEAPKKKTRSRGVSKTVEENSEPQVKKKAVEDAEKDKE